MGVYTTKPIKEISAEELKYLIKEKAVEIADHALFHLSNKQRKIFNVEELLQMIQKETPRKVYLQENGRYRAYYRKKDGFRKLIVEIGKKVVVVSFMDEIEIPRITIKHEYKTS